MKKKISLIGAGQIGGTMAHISIMAGMGDVVLFDVNEGTAKGKALDIQQASALSGKDCSIIGTADYSQIANSDVIIVTAGFPRKPGMSRDDLLQANGDVMRSVGQNVMKYSPNSFVIVVTNPLDVMVQLFYQVTQINPKKLVGMAGVLDSIRFRTLLAQEFNVSAHDVGAFVLGGHGDTMVPIIRYATISGIPVPDLLKMGLSSQAKIDNIVDKTKNGGGEIVKLLGNGSAYYAPAASALEMAESYLMDRKRLLPCASYLNGEYGIKGLYIGVPVVIGKGGVEKVIELQLNEYEQNLFYASVDATKKLFSSINL